MNQNLNDQFDLTKMRQKRTRVNSKAKGHNFERKIAGLFNDKFQTTEFAKTPGSGAFATTHTLPKHLQIYGDLITPKEFRFVIECKKGYNKENIGSAFKPDSMLNQFIEQSERDAEKSGKEPMLILEQDRKSALTITRRGNVFQGFLSSFNYVMVYIAVKRESNTIKEYNIILLSDILTIPNNIFKT